MQATLQTDRQGQRLRSLGKRLEDEAVYTKGRDALVALVPEPEIEGKEFCPVEKEPREVVRGRKESEMGREEESNEFPPVDKEPRKEEIGRGREGGEIELVSAEPDAGAGGAVPDPPAAADSCAKPTEGGSARKTE